MTTRRQMYVAVVPPPDVVEIIDRLPTRAQRGVRYTRRERWHVTLKFLGDADENAAAEALWEMRAQPAEVTLGPAVSLLGNRIMMVPAGGLDELATATDEAFEGVGEPQPARKFEGHLTLARLKGAPLRDPSTISVLGAPIEANFRATSVALFGMEVSNDGSTRTLVAEMPLSE